MTDAPASLTARERRVLADVCNALLPRLLAGPGDLPALFDADAASLGTAGIVEQAIATLSARQRSELRLFLRLLDTPAFMLLVTGRPFGFTGLDVARRERALLALANHPLPPLRTGFQALKRLATFLFYSTTADERPHPLLPLLGYDVPSRRAGAPLVRVERPEQDEVITADACVVGSGAGGGVVAELLAAAGQSVVVVEAGPGDQGGEFDPREIVGTQRLYLDRGTTATRDLSVAILAGSALGGGTAINWQTSLETPDYVRDEWAHRSGVRAFTDAEFTGAIAAVRSRCHATTDESVRSPNNAALERGSAALGYGWSLIPRNARGCESERCGFCVYGCPIGAKQSTTVTCLADAQRLHGLRVLVECRVERVLVSGGAAAGVEAVRVTPQGNVARVRVNASVVVVAAGALETPLLLMRSGITHAELGRNLYLHPTTAVAGRYAEPIEGWKGPPQSILTDHLARMSGNYGARLETPPIHPGLFALALPWHGARQHRRDMQQLAHTGAFIVLSRDRNAGRVRADREGRGIIDYRVGRAERDILRAGAAAAARIHWAAGARQVETLHARRHLLDREADGHGADIDRYCDAILRLPMGDNRCAVFSAHQMGTARMGARARDSVCDENGAVRGTRGLYVADGSLFPASSGVNPMITIMALAHMVGTRLSSSRA